MQLTHHNTNFQEKIFPITVICDGVYFQENIGAIFRICDAFGVENIIFSGKNFIFSERKINKTSRSTHKTLPFQIIKESENLIDFIQNNFDEVYILELTSNSKNITSLQLDDSKKTALIIGNEINGVSENILHYFENHFHIEMFGKNSSMNVVQALSIGLFQLTK